MPFPPRSASDGSAASSARNAGLRRYGNSSIVPVTLDAPGPGRFAAPSMMAFPVGGTQNVEASTINGDIEFEGTAADRGRYTFNTHNGDITIAVPESSNVSFSVRTYQGRFSPALNVSGPPRSEVRQGRRTTYTLGTGSAEMEVETFGGSIRLLSPSSFKSRASGKDKSKDPEKP